MPRNKNSIIRYQTLDRCFSNRGRMYFMEDLIDACSEALKEFNYPEASVSRRQIFEDIRYMESEQGWSIPLQRFNYGRRAYYRYSDTSFSINQSPLNPDEWDLLRSAISLTNRVFGEGPFSGISRLFSKVDKTAGCKNLTRFVSYDENPYVEGLAVLPDLFNSIVNRRVIRVVYQSFTAIEPVEFVLSPLHLRQYQGRWFLFGFDNSKGYITTLPTDRIKSIAETSDMYDPAGETVFEDWFEDIVGVTRRHDQEPETVELKILGDSIPYVKSKPLHGSQKTISQTDKELFLSLQLIPNYEFDKLLLGLGKNLVIIGPESYKLHFKRIIIGMAQNLGLRPDDLDSPDQK